MVDVFLGSSVIGHLSTSYGFGLILALEVRFWVYIKICGREILTNVIRALINNPFKENFYGKRKEKTINVLTVFFISYKSGIKTFLKWIVNQCLKDTH